MATKKLPAKSKNMPNRQATRVVMDDLLLSELLTKESNSVLKIAVIVSIVFHLLLLSIKFGGAEALEQLFKGKTLEVVLLNAKTDDAPSNPQVTAQVNSAGGGDSDNNDLPTAPDSYAPLDIAGDSFEDQVTRIRAEENENLRILQAAKDSLANLPPVDPSWGQDDPRRIAEEERRRQLSAKIAVLDQKMQELSARPRRMVIAPSAKRDDQALYFEAIRAKIEQKGNDAFPRIGGVPIFGKLQVELIVNPKGDFVSAKIMESSGNPVLDNQALAIAREAAPFQAAPQELLKIEPNVEFVFFMRFSFLNSGKAQVERIEKR